MPLKRRGNSLLRVGSKLATSDDCCCDEPTQCCQFTPCDGGDSVLFLCDGGSPLPNVGDVREVNGVCYTYDGIASCVGDEDAASLGGTYDTCLDCNCCRYLTHCDTNLAIKVKCFTLPSWATPGKVVKANGECYVVGTSFPCDGNEIAAGVFPLEYETCFDCNPCPCYDYKINQDVYLPDTVTVVASGLDPYDWFKPGNVGTCNCDVISAITLSLIPGFCDVYYSGCLSIGGCCPNGEEPCTHFYSVRADKTGVKWGVLLAFHADGNCSDGSRCTVGYGPDDFNAAPYCLGTTSMNNAGQGSVQFCQACWKGSVTLLV